MTLQADISSIGGTMDTMAEYREGMDPLTPFDAYLAHSLI